MAIISDANGSWELHDPAKTAIAYRHTDDTYSTGRWHDLAIPLVDRTIQPYRDDDTSTLVDELIDSLILMRSGSTSDGGAQLSVIASLVAELDSRVPEAIFDALDQDYTWRQIAGRLAMVESTIRRRYRDYVASRKEKPVDHPD